MKYINVKATVPRGHSLVVNAFENYGNTTNGQMKNRKCG